MVAVALILPVSIILITIFLYEPYFYIEGIAPESNSGYLVAHYDDTYYYISGNEAYKLENDKSELLYTGKDILSGIACDKDNIYFFDYGDSACVIDKKGNIANPQFAKELYSMRIFPHITAVLNDYLYIMDNGIKINLNDLTKFKYDKYYSLTDDDKVKKYQYDNYLEIYKLNSDKNYEFVAYELSAKEPYFYNWYVFEKYYGNDIINDNGHSIKIITCLDDESLIIQNFGNKFTKLKSDGTNSEYTDYSKIYEYNKGGTETEAYMSDDKLIVIMSNFGRKSSASSLCWRVLSQRPYIGQESLLSAYPSEVFITDLKTDETKSVFKSKEKERILYADTEKVAVLSKKKVTVYDINTKEPIKTIKIPFIRRGGGYRVSAVGDKIFFFNLDKTFAGYVDVD